MTTTQMSAAETVIAFLNAGTAFDYDADRERLRLREHADRQGQWPGGGARGAGAVLLATGWAVENGLITVWREYFDAAAILSNWSAR